MKSFRLPKQIESDLDYESELTGKSRSDVIREALVQYLAVQRESRSSSDLGNDLFGAGSSGATDLSVTYKEKLGQALNEKFGPR